MFKIKKIILKICFIHNVDLCVGRVDDFSTMHFAFAFKYFKISPQGAYLPVVVYEN